MGELFAMGADWLMLNIFFMPDFLSQQYVSFGFRTLLRVHLVDSILLLSMSLLEETGE